MKDPAGDAALVRVNVHGLLSIDHWQSVGGRVNTGQFSGVGHAVFFFFLMGSTTEAHQCQSVFQETLTTRMSEK